MVYKGKLAMPDGSIQVVAIKTIKCKLVACYSCYLCQKFWDLLYTYIICTEFLPFHSYDELCLIPYHCLSSSDLYCISDVRNVYGDYYTGVASADFTSALKL